MEERRERPGSEINTFNRLVLANELRKIANDLVAVVEHLRETAIAICLESPADAEEE